MSIALYIIGAAFLGATIDSLKLWRLAALITGAGLIYVAGLLGGIEITQS